MAINLKAVRGGESALAMAKRRYSTVQGFEHNYIINLTSKVWASQIYSLGQIFNQLSVKFSFFNSHNEVE